MSATATATGFQYTPPSYLMRASDTTNRPWSKTEEGEGDTGDNEYDLPQEHRPQTRRESHLDAHFQQRVRNKKSRYSTILKGEAADHDVNYGTAVGHDDEDEDSILAAAKNADSFADVHSAKLIVQSASSNQKARRNRKERITGLPEPCQRSDSTASRAENARTLRAQRLRSTLLKQTSDESDVQTKMEMRRLSRKDEEKAARRIERDAMANDPTFHNDTISSRKDIEQKRQDREASREALAKEDAAIALVRAAELNEERIRELDRESRLEDYRQEEERMARRERRHRKNSKKNSKEHRQNKNKTMGTTNYSGIDSTNSDGDTFMTVFDAENDFAFLNDITGIVRESTILKSCGSCFGDTDNVEEEDTNSFKVKACAAISSVFVPELVPCSDNSASDADDGDRDIRMSDSHSIRRSREYARYRE